MRRLQRRLQRWAVRRFLAEQPSFGEFFRANFLDGDRGGVVTVRAEVLVEDVQELFDSFVGRLDD